MTRTLGRGLLALVLVLALGAGRAHAQLSKCGVLKARAAAKSTFGKAICHAKGAVGGGVDPACLSAQTAKFTAKSQSAEAKGDCVAPGDTSAVNMAVDDFVNDLVASLGTSATEAAAKCLACKLRAAGKNVVCVEKASVKGLGKILKQSADAVDTTKCDDKKMASAWDKCEIEAAGDCPTLLDVGAVYDGVTTFATSLPSMQAVKIPCDAVGVAGILPHEDCVAANATCAAVETAATNQSNTECDKKCQAFGQCQSPQVCKLKSNTGNNVTKETNPSPKCKDPNLPKLCSVARVFDCDCKCV